MASGPVRRARCRFTGGGLRIEDHFSPAGSGDSDDLLLTNRTGLAFLRGGSAELTFENRRLLLDPSRVVLMHREIEYRITPGDLGRTGCVTVVSLDSESMRTRSLHRGRSGFVPITAPWQGLIHDLHVLLALTRRNGGGPSPAATLVTRCAGRALEAAVEAAAAETRSGDGSGPGLSDLARRAREVVVRRADERLSVHAVAEAIDRSRFHVCRVFRAEVGMTINQYQQRVRVSEALHRLGEGEEDLLGLAFELGYSSHSHFTSVFRRLIGVPPSEVFGRLCGTPRSLLTR